MSWHARLIDGPLEGQVMAVEPEADNEPPPILEVEGQRYVFCGFSEDMPRYRHKADTASG